MGAMLTNWSGLGSGLSDVGPATFWFMAAAAILGALDISMPRRDAIGVGSSLDVVALIVLSSLPAALFTAAAGAVASLLVRFRTASPQLAVGAFVARLTGVLGAALFVGIGDGLTLSTSVSWAVAVAAVCIYLLVELAVVQVFNAAAGGRSRARAVTGGLALQWPLLLAQASSALLTIIIYPTLGAWSLPLAMALLLLIRQSYSLLLEMRETFRTTTEVLVEVAEHAQQAKRGHAERTSRIARVIAGACGMSTAEIDRIGYAALLHDIGEIGREADEQVGMRASAAVIEEVHFFADVADVLRVCDGRPSPDGRPTPESARFAAFIVALSSDIEEIASGRDSDGFTWVSHSAELAASVSPALKARAVSAAVRAGYGTPAVA